jgi:hypothetical protein
MKFFDFLFGHKTQDKDVWVEEYEKRNQQIVRDLEDNGHQIIGFLPSDDISFLKRINEPCELEACILNASAICACCGIKMCSMHAKYHERSERQYCFRCLPSR